VRKNQRLPRFQEAWNFRFSEEDRDEGRQRVKVVLAVDNLLPFEGLPMIAGIAGTDQKDDSGSGLDG
jgi:hypothetical protein